MPDLPDWAQGRWYPVRNDLIGGWCVTNEDRTPASGPYPVLIVADFITEEVARYVADLHNRTLPDPGPLRAYVPGLGDDPAPSGTNAEWVQGGVPRPGDPIAVYDHHAMLLGAGRVSEVDESHGIVRIEVSSVRRVEEFPFPFPVPPAEGDPDA